MTFLEVVFAAGLLAAAAAAITSAFSTIMRFTAHEEARLAANEVAHRLILQYLDDPAALHPGTDVFEMGRSKFRYLVNKQVLLPEQVGVPENVSKSTTGQAATTGFTEKLTSKLQMVTMEVYEDRGVKPSGEPLARMVRIYNPLENAEDDPEAFTRQIIELASDDPVIQEMFRAAFNSVKQQQQQQQALKKAQEKEKAANKIAPPGSRAAPKRIGEGKTP